MQRLAAVVVVAVLSGCARDLEIPSRNTLAVVQPFVDAAPCQQLDVAVTGGAGGYRFAFAAGGKLSGEDATVDVATGRYRAGSAGSAQDVVEVTDAAGAAVVARISVHGRVSVSPGIAGVAPGGTVLFSVSGGLTPYSAFELESAPSGGQIGSPGASTFSYVAGSVGDVTDVVVVKDATGDPAAWARVQIRVGTRLALLASSDHAAPGEEVTLLAVGGEPPYTWTACAPPGCTGTAPSGGAFVNAAGTYRAGPTGNVTDLLRITDVHGETADLTLAVGPPLRLSIPGGPTPDLRPGSAVQLLAEGGKPPYTFGFAARGDRSGGTVDRVTGVYVPGLAVGARDVPEVVDSAGATATAWNVAPVGHLQLPFPNSDALACWSAELNRDGRGDVIVGDRHFNLTVATGIGSSTAVVDQYFLGLPREWDPGSNRGPQGTLMGDWNGDGRDDLATVDRADGVRFYVTGLLGTLEPGPHVPTVPGVFEPNQIARVVASDGAQLFYTNDQAWGAICGGGSGQVRLRWVPGAVPTVNVECVAMGGYNPRAMFTGDFDGDGWTDIGMFDGASGADLSRDLRVLWGTADANGVALTAVTYPGLIPADVVLSYSHDDYDAHQQVLAAPQGFLAHVLDVGTGRGKVIAARCEPGTRTWTVSPAFDPTLGGYGITRIASYTPFSSKPTYVGWNEVDGALTAIDVDLTDPAFTLASSATVTAAPLGTRVGCAAFSDVNADGAPDLVTGGGEVVWGRGAYGVGALAGEARFGSRIHYTTMPWGAPGHFDEDELLDLVGSETGGDLSLLFGVDGQLARGGQIAAMRAGPTFAGRFFAPYLHDSLVVMDQTSTLWSLTGNGDGTFGEPVVMSVQDPAGSPALLQDGEPMLVGGRPALVEADRDGVQVVLLRSPTLAVSVTAPPFAGDLDVCKGLSVGETGLQKASATLAVACLVRPPLGGEWNQVVVQRITLSNLDGVPTFGGWSGAVLTTSNPTVERVDLGGTSSPLGAVFWAYYRTPRELRVLTIGEASASEDPLSTSLRAQWGGLSAPLRAAAPEDVVVEAEGGLLVLRQVAGHWTLAQELFGGTGIPIAVGRLALGAPPVVLTSTGYRGRGAAPELIVVESDGNGFLR